MGTTFRVPACFIAMLGLLGISAPALAHVSMGTGSAGLLGGDLTDPRDAIVPSDRSGGTESDLKPRNAMWVKMTCWPISGPYATPHHPSPYRSQTGSPAAAIFMNKPEQMKWSVSFKDGGYGGPTKDDPYFAAVEFKDAYVLTHFTVTAGGDSPGRDPKEWALQGSNTGEADDWTDIYACQAKDRSGTAFQEGSRNETFLFSSFTSAELVKIAMVGDVRKIQGHLGGKTIAKADFVRPKKAYTWFRIVVYSCFNPSFVNYIYNNNSPSGFSLGQLELFGSPGRTEKPTPKVVKADPPAKPPVVDTPFIITYWCGPPKADTTLERYKEIAECGFNVAFAAIDNLWEPASKDQDEHNRKVLDLCQQTGMKALLWDGSIRPKPATKPKIEKALDGMIARYSSHPALLGFIIGDEMPGAHAELGVLNQYLLKKDPKHLPYYNNLPSYAFSSPMAYERSVVDYLNVVKPAMFSWDHYRQMFESGDEQYYWENLEIVRRNCLKAKVPYLQIIVSIKHMGYRECSEADLRWQVWTSLAYGSRGITYFTYCYVPGMAWGDSPALLAKNGTRDVKWGYAQKINRRIAQLGPTLVKLVSTGVYLTGPLPNGTRPLLPEAPVRKANGGDMAIGCFQQASGEKGPEYIMPVNRSISNAIKASLRLDEKYVSASEISQETGKLLPPVSVTDTTLDVPLDAGEGKLFLLNKKK